MKRTHHLSGSPWEPKIGYSRALRAGQFIYVSGTTGTDASGKVVGPDAYSQAAQALKTVRAAIEALGGTMKDVVRTRIYVTNMAEWQEIARAHGEVFSEIKPATAILEVKLISPEMKVEIEADAIVAGPPG